MRPREEGTAAVVDDDRPDAPFPDAVTAPAVLPTFSPSKPAAPGSRAAAPNALDRATNAPPDFDAVFAEVLTSDLFDEALTTLTRPTANPPEAQPFAIESPDTAPNKGGGGASGHDAAGGGGGGNGGASSPQHGHTAADGNSAVAASSGAHSTATEAGGEPVSPRNGSPVARGDEYRLWTGVGTSVSGNVGDNDDAPSGSTFSLMSHPDHGEVQFNSDGSFIYTLQTSWHGEEDLFSYRLWSGGVYAQASVRIDLLDNTPLAMDDEYKGAIAGAEFTVSAAEGVLINDIEYDNEPLSDATLVAGPANGSVALNSDGSFSYTADDDFFGWDSFTYICSDGKNFGESATVSIGVNAVRILLNGQDITNPRAPAELWVGNKAQLEVGLIGQGGLQNVTFTNIQWSIPDWAVQGWNVLPAPAPRTGPSSATIDPLEGAELQSQSVGFHWVTDGLKQVSVTATITAKVIGKNMNVQWNGTKTGEANVKRPEGTIGTTKDQLRYHDVYDPPVPGVHEDFDIQAVVVLGDYHGKATDADATEGVRFINLMTSDGSYQWVQIMRSFSSYATGINGNVIKNEYEYDVLDGFYPYPYSNQAIAADSPAQAFDPSWRYHTREDVFTMHLQFKAPGDPDAIWVSVAQVSWWWSYEADSAGGVLWDVYNPVFEVESSLYNEELPTWDGVHGSD